LRLLVQAGLVELAVGAMFGWLVVLRLEAAPLLARVGVTSPRRILQAHIDYLMMGLILIAVGLALPALPALNKAALLFGTAVNPTLFLPLAFREEWSKHIAYRAVSVASFAATSGGLVAAAFSGL
jgi:hypothetical protein